MIVKKIEFECIDDDVNYSYDVKKKAKHITNYINRVCLSKIKFKSDDFNIIVIYLMENEKSPYITNKGLIIPIHFSKEKYDNFINDDEYRYYYFSCIEKSLMIASNLFSVPQEEILKSLYDFKKNNYLNNWIYQEKKDKQKQIIALLKCSLTIDYFELKLIVKFRDTVILDRIVLKTDPDEVAFEYRFKEIIIQSEKIIVTAKTQNILLEFNFIDNHLIVFNNE